MHEAACIMITALTNNVVIEEAAADALFTASRELERQGTRVEADAILALSRMHRIKALSLRGHVAVLRDIAVRRYQNGA